MSIQQLPVTGAWTVTLTSTDRWDNVTESFFTIDVLPDTQGPSLVLSSLNGRNIPQDGAITLLPSVWAANKTPELKGGVSDPSGIDQLTVTITAPDSSSETYSVTVGPASYFSFRPNLKMAGTWSFVFEALDKAGNATTKTLTVSIEDDVAGPTFSGLKVNKETVPDTGDVTVDNTLWRQLGKRVLLSGVVTDAGAGLKAAMVTLTSPNGTEGAPLALRVGAGGSFTATLPLPAEGVWTAMLDGEDKLGNPTTQSFAIEVLPDTTGPVVKLGSLGGRMIPANLSVTVSAGAWLANKTPVLRGGVSDFSGVEKLAVVVTAPDAATTAADIPLSTSGSFVYRLNLTTVGTWSYTFTATDKAGNDSVVTLVVNVQDDQDAPVLSIKVNGTDVPASGTVSLSNADWIARGKRAYISGQVSDAGAGLELLTVVLTRPDSTTATYRLTPSNGRFSSYVSLPTVGTWTLTFTAKDRLGNITTAPVTIEVLH